MPSVRFYCEEEFVYDEVAAGMPAKSMPSAVPVVLTEMELEFFRYAHKLQQLAQGMVAKRCQAAIADSEIAERKKLHRAIRRKRVREGLLPRKEGRGKKGRE